MLCWVSACSLVTRLFRLFGCYSIVSVIRLQFNFDCLVRYIVIPSVHRIVRKDWGVSHPLHPPLNPSMYMVPFHFPLLQNPKLFVIKIFGKFDAGIVKMVRNFQYWAAKASL